MTKLSFPLLHPGTAARRWLRRLGLAWGAWLLVGAVVLNQPLMEGWINRTPVKFHVQWDFALSLLPGHVTAWGIDLRGQANQSAFGAHVVRGSAWVSPWALFGRTLRLSDAHASGVAVALRKGKVALPPPAPREHPWTVEVSDASFSELWSVTAGPGVVLAGRGHGRLDLRKVLSGGALEIPSAQLQWRELEVLAGGLAVAEAGTLEAEFALAPLAPRSTAVQQLRAASLNLSLDSRLVPLSLDRKGLHLGDSSDAGSRLAARISLVNGRLDDNSRLELDLPLSVADGERQNARKLKLALGVRDRKLTLEASLPRGKQPETTMAANLWLPLPRLDQLQADGRAETEKSLTRFLLGQVSGSIDLSLRFRNLGLIKPWLAKWRGLEATGDGWMHAALVLEKGKFADTSTLEFEDVSLSAAAMGHRIEAQLDGPLTLASDDSGRRQLSLQQVRLFGPDDLLLLEDAGAQLDLVPYRGGEPGLHWPGMALAIRDADLPNIAVFNAYLPPGAVALGTGRATLGLDIALDATDASANGTLGLQAPSVQVRMGDMRLQGALSLDAELRDADFERKTLDASGSRLALRDVRFDGPGGRSVSGWSMDATLSEARADVAVPFHLEGSGHVAMSDLRLLLTVYSQISDYPLWILRLADAGKVTANGRFDLGDGQFRLSGLHAKNERFEVDARLLLGEKTQRGALLANWGPLAVAVELGDAGSRMHVVDARDWYRQAPQ